MIAVCHHTSRLALASFTPFGVSIFIQKVLHYAPSEWSPNPLPFFLLLLTLLLQSCCVNLLLLRLVEPDAYRDMQSKSRRVGLLR